jgi:hypothetical protein
MRESITLDDSLWPLLITRFDGMATDAHYEEHFARGLALLERGEQYVSVVDLSNMATPTVAQRQRQAAWLKEHTGLMRERVLGCALVITSPIIRLALSAVLHLRPLPVPYVVVPDMASGMEWALVQLEQAGLGAQAGRLRQLLLPRRRIS